MIIVLTSGSSGKELELFSIEREDGVFVKNISTSWSSTGNIGTLTISPDGKSAKFLALTEGVGKIQILEGGKVVYSLDLETIELENRIQNFNINNITSNGFEVLIETQYPLIGSDSATFYYCNNTKIPNCDPKQWYSLEMVKSGTDFNLTSPAFKFPDDPKDEFNIVASVTLNTGLDERSDKVVLDGPAQIYRSIGVGNTTALVTRISSGINEASIINSIITFDSSLADNVGIGDCIVVDHSVAVGFEEAFFIRKRITSNQYLLNDSNGNELSSDYNSITDWEIYRSYTSIPDSGNLNENTGIPTEVRDFDTSQDAVSDNKAWNFAFYADAPWVLVGNNAGLGSWNVRGDNYLRYYVPFLSSEVGVSQRHEGVWDNSKARIDHTATSDYDWPFIQRNSGRNAIRIEGFQFEVDSNGYASVYAFRMDSYQLTSDAYGYFHNNIIKGVGSGGFGGGVSLGSSTSLKGYIFVNIAYNNDGEALTAGGPNSVMSHNTSYNNRWNYYGASGNGGAYTTANISIAGTQYEFRGGYSSNSDLNIAGPASFSSPPGANSLTNSTLGDVSFIDTTPGSENLCTDNLSIAYILGPRMIDESDPYKIYYDAAGNIRNPNDLVFPLGACSQ